MEYKERTGLFSHGEGCPTRLNKPVHFLVSIINNFSSCTSRKEGKEEKKKNLFPPLSLCLSNSLILPREGSKEIRKEGVSNVQTRHSP